MEEELETREDVHSMKIRGHNFAAMDVAHPLGMQLVFLALEAQGGNENAQGVLSALGVLVQDLDDNVIFDGRSDADKADSE